MATVILVCGKVCSGKTLYANEIKATYNAVVLSYDDIIYKLMKKYTYATFKKYCPSVYDYLLGKAEEIAMAGGSVILDCGFETKAMRDEAKKRLTDKGLCVKIHYIEVSNDAWVNNIAKRNIDATTDACAGFMVDDEIKSECIKTFEEPLRDEVDIWLKNSGAPAVKVPDTVQQISVVSEKNDAEKKDSIKPDVSTEQEKNVESAEKEDKSEQAEENAEQEKPVMLMKFKGHSEE